MTAILTLIFVAGSLGLFLFGMKILSEGLQKMAGTRMKSVLRMMTKNRFMAVLTGVGITALIQSSSATTVMVVSFVNAGLMTLSQSIGVILGANIGTTITAWIVALIGFTVDISSLSLLAIAIALPLQFSKKTYIKNAGELLMGLGLLFLGLHYLQASMPDLSSHIEVLAFLQKLNSGSPVSLILCVLIGMVITMIIQSSAAAMTLTITMAYQGYVGVNAAAALCLGQNIGTTITAWLASLRTSTAAKQSAWAHILFNIIGSVLALILFKPFMNLVNSITPGDVYSMTGTSLTSTLPTFLATFHTTFNVVNTLLFLPFVKQFAKLIERLIPTRDDYEGGTYHFTYIGNPFIDSPEIYLPVIKDEVKKLAEVAKGMLADYRAFFNKDHKELDAFIESEKKAEEYADQMQEQLIGFCVHMVQKAQVPTNAEDLNACIRVIDELESVTDSIYNLACIARDRCQQGWRFNKETEDAILQYEALVNDYLNFISSHIGKTFDKADLAQAYRFEEVINNERNRNSSLVETRLAQSTSAVKQELLTLEIIRHLEHIGDFCTNIAETMAKAAKHEPVLRKS
ncbi:MAG: Na/Pi cotransporter family protein [Sphaerochaetaceae bacterium]|nr:Na/Pi cotransporter family protein [Sphaerochaetaceae bacterium]